MSKNALKQKISSSISSLFVDEVENEDIPSHGFKDLDKGILVGHGIKMTDNPDEMIPQDMVIPWSDWAGHAVVFGTTRVGKTRLMMAMVRQVILNNENIIIVEPKGSPGQEVIAWTLEFLEEAGRLEAYKYISPLYPEHSFKINTLFGLTDLEISSLIRDLINTDEDYIKDMGEDITINILNALSFLEAIENKDKVKEEIEKEYMKLYKKGISNENMINPIDNVADPDLAERYNKHILNNLNDEHFEPPYRSLVTLRDIFLYSSKEKLQQLLDKVVEIDETAFDENLTDRERMMLEELQETTIVSIEQMLNLPNEYFNKLKKSYDKTIRRIATDSMKEIFSSVRVNPLIDLLRQKKEDGPGIVLILQPFSLKFKSISDAFIRMFFSSLMVLMGDVGATGRLFNRNLFVFVDEGGSVMYKGVEHLFNKAGALGMRMVILTQAFSDYKVAVDEDIAKVINDNTNIKIYLKMNDEDSRELVSRSFGTIKRANINTMVAKIDTRIGVTDGDDVDLFTSADVGDLQSRECFLQSKETGRVFMKAPFQKDAVWDIEMPTSQYEKYYDIYQNTLNKQEMTGE